MYLLDTNICSAFIREDERIISKISSIDENLLMINWVIAGELRFGAIKKGSDKLTARVNQFLDTFDIVMPNSTIIESYARVRHQLSSEGRIIGSNDLWIASHAVADGLIVVTHNVKEFSRVDELKIENWLD